MLVLTPFFRFATPVLAALLFTGGLSAGEKKLMHCFAFTPIESASDAQWQAFYKATDVLPAKIPGIIKVWYGKLTRPLSQWQGDAATRAQMNAQTPALHGNFNRLVRSYGVCMELASENTLKGYAEHPYHKEWSSAYEKVRVEGTTTFDIIGQ